MNWDSSSIPCLNGKIIVVTGGNSGIGFEVTKRCSEHDAQVIIATRNAKRGEDAVNLIKNQFPDSSVRSMVCDLESLQSIREFTQRFRSEYNQLDYLFNNAGIMAVPYGLTEDGFERQFGVNHLGHFALTGYLLPLITQTKGSRVITVSSGAHRRGNIDFDDLLMKRNYSGLKGYNRSKLANLYFAYELQHKFEINDIHAMSLAAHPGLTYSNLPFQERGWIRSRIAKAIINFGFKIISQPTEMGALPILYAAFSEMSVGGRYYGPDGWTERRGYPTEVESTLLSHDREIARKLWRVSEELTGVRYNF